MEVQVKVAPSTYAFGQALGSFVSEIKKALDDGWQPAADVPVILLEGIKTLAPAVSKLADVLGESAGDKEAFANALALTVIKVASGVVK